MKKTRRFTALLLALIMTLSMMPLDAVAEVFTTYEDDNVTIEVSGSKQIGEELVASKVSTPDGYTVVVTSLDEILPADGWVEFADEAPVNESPAAEKLQTAAKKSAPRKYPVSAK